MLTAMAMVGLAVGCVCLLETAGGAVTWASEPVSGTIHKPIVVHMCPQTIVRPRYYGAIDFCEGHCAPLIAHGDTREKGVGRQAGNDVGCSCAGWKIWQVLDCTLSPLGRWAMRGTSAGTMLVAGASVVRKWLVTPESRIAHRLMVAALVVIVLRRTEAASA